MRARCLFPLALAAGLLVSAAGLAQDRPLVILGFDGADAKLTERWMDEGKLPNLAALRDQGSFRPLRSTVPSQTPVSWSTFATGLNPGRHAIFDFLKRDPQTYTPSFAASGEVEEPFLWGERTPLVVGIGIGALLTLVFFGLLRLLRARARMALVFGLAAGLAGGVGASVVAGRLLPKQRPVAVNNQQGDTFWEILGAAGKRVEVMRIPVTFPPEPFEHGHLLTGLGTPDVSLRIGKPFYFTSELFFKPRTGDFSGELVELIDNRGVIPTEIKGPPNKLFPDAEPYITIPMTLTVAEDRSHLDIEVSGSHLSLEPGQWSGWVPIEFPFNALIKLGGIGRFYLISLEDEVRLYLSPIQFDPTNLPPMTEITFPNAFVDDLTGRVGRFKTIGWAIDTWSLEEGTIDEDVFFQDVDFTVSKYEEMLYGLLEDRHAGGQDWDVLVHYFEFTDRVQHMMWRYFDPKHPLYTEEGAAKYGDAILNAYQRMDAIVGETRKRMPNDGMLMVVSDHGFASFRRAVNYNTWLVKNGFMRLNGEDADRKNLEDLFGQGDFFVNVDWSATQAYALGLGQIYINLQGREKNGIVKPGADYERVTNAIHDGLLAYVDEETGEHPVVHVWRRDEVYTEYDPSLIPDLIPSNGEGYRVGWQDSLGGIAKTVVEDNDHLWSGDHCSVYPPLVDGILFANIPLSNKRADMVDVMPTVLDLYHVAPTTHLDGESLLPAR